MAVSALPACRIAARCCAATLRDACLAVATPDEINIDNLAPVFGVAEQLDVLLVGLGPQIGPLDKAIRQALREPATSSSGHLDRQRRAHHNILLGGEPRGRSTDRQSGSAR